MDTWFGPVLLAVIALLFVLKKWKKTQKAMELFIETVDILACSLIVLVGAGVVVVLVGDLISGKTLDLSRTQIGILFWAVVGLIRISSLFKKDGKNLDSAPENSANESPGPESTKTAKEQSEND